MRRFALLLVFGLALGQTLLPVEQLGLTFREEGGAWVYQGGGKRYVYVPGVGWAEPLGAELPPPQEGLFPLEALKALGHFRGPSPS